MSKSYLSPNNLEKHSHAFITSRLDFCNSLYFGLERLSRYRLQLVQNAAAPLLTGIKGHDHVTPVFAGLHWLTDSISILTFFYLLLKLYVWHPVISNRAEWHKHQEKSSSQMLLVQPRSRLKHGGDRPFAVAAPGLWNNRRPNIRTAKSIRLLNPD